MPENFKKVFETNFFSIESSEKIFENDHPYYRISEKDSVICCVLDQLDRFVLVEQFRPVLGHLTIEFPAGQIEDGETPINAAEREFYEETLLDAEMHSVGSFSLMPNRSTSQVHGFFGFTDNADKINVKNSEGISLIAVKRDDFKKRILSNSFHHMAGLGVLKAAEIYFNFNLLSDNFNYILRKFANHKRK
jgi:ADP-ribose pyrophosphatase